MRVPVLDRVFGSRLLQQTLALTYKNVLVAWRNRRATVLRLMAPFVFLLLALIIQLSLDANSRRQQRIKAAEYSDPAPFPSIPDCNEDLYIGRRSCYTFLYSPNSSTVVQDIISGIKQTNSPPIKDDKVLGFANVKDAEDYMLAHPETTLGAVHFSVDNGTGATKVNYVIQSNSTVKRFKGNEQSPSTFFALPVQAAVAREVSRLLNTLSGRSADAFDWQPNLLKFPHPQLRSIGMAGYVLGPFIFASCMFGLVIQLGAIVGEKESGLVTSLRHMGLLQSSYWLSWVSFDLLMGLATALSIVMWGNILQFRFFLRNDSGLLVLLFWLFLLAMSSFSYFLSIFMSKQQSAVYLGFTVFLVGWIMQTIAIFGLPYDPEYYYTKIGYAFFWIFACLPWCPLIKGTLDLAAATGSDKDPGLRWSERSSYCQYISDPALQPAHDSTKTFMDFDCVYPLNDIFINLVVQAAAWLVLALYLDNVWPAGSGKTRPLWYFLLPSYWVNHRATTAKHLRKTNSISSTTGRYSLDGDTGVRTSTELHRASMERKQTADLNVAVIEAAPSASSSNDGGDEDVEAEAVKMKALLKHKITALTQGPAGSGRSNRRIQHLHHAAASADRNLADLSVKYAVEVFGLSKVFKAPISCCPSSCKGDKGQVGDFWAIKGSWFGIEEGQLFCLLGPNGAGKTTTINCLTGILEPHAGDMLVCGESVCTEGGLDRIRPLIGVCPQFDVLWPELTGMEHLVISGHVKGLPFSEVRQHAAELLERVQLQAAANLRSSAYSGGMKRRLSVSLALLGNPRVLYLDEPTTGMDPISRRYVWDVIQAAKPGRAIVLTTHSMEEADILGDRIAIMARGAIKALGSSIRLKQKFGAGYQLIVTLKPDAKAQWPALQQKTGANPQQGAQGQNQAGTMAARQAIKDFVTSHVPGLQPEEEGKYTIRYAVPRDQQEQLVHLLQLIEKAALGSGPRELTGIADVQLSLTSLEEVFLAIAKRAELEAAAVTGATVSIHLPDSGKQVQVAVGQDWYDELPSGSEGLQKRYGIKWVQDESGRLTVLEVSAPRLLEPAIEGRRVGSLSSTVASQPANRSAASPTTIVPLAPVAS